MLNYDASYLNHPDLSSREDNLTAKISNEERLKTICMQLRHQYPNEPAHSFPFLVFQKTQELSKKANFLDLDEYTPAKTGYKKYILYTYKDSVQPFCFTLIVLAPGQSTLKHNHRVDCGPICIKGKIDEIRYHEIPPFDSSGRGTLVEHTRFSYLPGEGGYLLKDQPNAHALMNSSDQMAMSLHIYLFDPDACSPEMCTSIKNIYP